MDLGSWWIVDVIGPVILLLVLIGSILTARSHGRSGLKGRSDEVARALRPREERREGTDGF
jgi:hypothetical protein